MVPLLNNDIQVETEFIQRFVRSYRRRFACAIQQLNRRPASPATVGTELQCLKLCVETMDMILVNQDRMAGALRKLTAGQVARRAA